MAISWEPSRRNQRWLIVSDAAGVPPRRILIASTEVNVLDFGSATETVAGGAAAD